MLFMFLNNLIIHKRGTVSWGMQLFVAFIFIFQSVTAMAVSEPVYTVLQAENLFEIREYSGFFIAQTKADGDFDQAGSSGFRRIASYIFGKNKNANGEVEKIAMTAPVTMVQEGNEWRVHFVMPQGYTSVNLPRPLDREIELLDIPSTVELWFVLVASPRRPASQKTQSNSSSG